MTDEMLVRLREDISRRLSDERFAHTLSVEREVNDIADRLLPDRVGELRAAALLHDLTKELSLSEQVRICRENAVVCSNEALTSGAVLHGFTAALQIPSLYPCFASPDILSAVRYHTVGHPMMSTFDKILFLADYIESTRRYPDCIALRERFWNEINSVSSDQYLTSLDAAVFTEVKQTITHLLKKNAVIAPESLALYNAYAARKDWQG